MSLISYSYLGSALSKLVPLERELLHAYRSVLRFRWEGFL